MADEKKVTINSMTLRDNLGMPWLFTTQNHGAFCTFNFTTGLPRFSAAK